MPRSKARAIGLILAAALTMGMAGCAGSGGDLPPAGPGFSLYASVKMYQNGTTWGYEALRIDQAGEVIPYSRDVMKLVGEEAKLIGEPMHWAFFTATVPRGI